MIAWHAIVDASTSSRLALALVHSLWQIGLVAGGLWVLQRVWKRQAVEVAYACYVAALVVSLAIVPITFALLSTQPGDDAREDRRALALTQATSGRAAPPVSPPQDRASGAAAAPPVATQLLAGEDLRRAWLVLAPWITLLYACGVALMLWRIVRGVRSAQRLRVRAALVDDGPLAAALRSLAAAWRLRVVPALAQVEGIAVPQVVGLARPTILLPLAAASGMPAHELEMILAHELAHVRRYDLWVNLVQRLAESLLFFNPFLWHLSRKISALREFCCDELTCRTLSAEPQPRVRYAQALVRVAQLAEQAAASGGKLADVAALAAPGRSPSELRRRVARLLGEPPREPLQLSRGGVLALAAIVVLFLVAPAITISRGPSANASDDAPIHATATSGIRNLSGGLRVEVVAIGAHDPSPELWWGWNGARLANVPFRVQGADLPLADGAMGRAVVFRVHPMTADAAVRHEVRPPSGLAYGEVVDDAGQPASGVFSQTFGLPPTARTFSLRVGVAAGKWNTLADADPIGGMAVGLGASIGVVFSDTFTRGDETIVVVSHSVPDRDTRLVAIGRDGKTHASVLNSQYSAGNANQSQYAFRSLRPADIVRFEFQARDFEWVTFDNLPVYPGDDKP
jgi:beta-lactamase regulating signal transducer with metallopeptidase domain